ncbi:hypothetical protein F2P81_003211 [Scophthalmus maximus]|uniref:Uncharacterized protein n=1 Tax=Scophthalmus maximus TaxID=52904 RepID=A0A6A4TDK4_SCOMX|nr:hypothetical protein F2P81_003211 [Scophthalmus maximus]
MTVKCAFDLYLYRSVDELTRIHSEPRQIHDNRPQGRARALSPPGATDTDVVGPGAAAAALSCRYKKPSDRPSTVTQSTDDVAMASTRQPPSLV